jgi:hypothetical protein
MMETNNATDFFIIHDWPFFKQTKKFCIVANASLGPFVLLLPNFNLFDFQIFQFWTYLMKVFPETRRA